MSRTITTRPKASRIYRCERRRGACGGLIRPGQEYVREAVPPGDMDIGNDDHWWVSRSCVPCWDVDEAQKYEWVRSHYSVPARSGALVRFTGGPVPVVGEIVDVSGGHLIVRGKGHGERLVLHPTWQVEYLSEPAGATG